MFTVYVLKSKRQYRLYVGLTGNLPSRFAEHQRGAVFSTKGWRPWKTVYTEKFLTRKAARSREKYLKSGIGKEYLKSIIPR